MSTFYHCRNLETDEQFEVTSVIDETAESMFGSPMCSEYSFHCSETECEPVMCRMFCEHGWAKDDNGCDICECAEPDECTVEYAMNNSMCPMARCAWPSDLEAECEGEVMAKNEL